MPWRVSAEEVNTQAILSLCDGIKDISAESPCRHNLQSADDPGKPLTISDYSVAAALPCNYALS